MIRYLRWLVFLAALGYLGTYLGYPTFSGLYGFLVFMPLFWYDERTEGIFTRATAVTFVAMMITFVGSYAYIGLILRPSLQDPGVVNLISNFVTVIYLIQVLVFILTSVYFQARGFGR